MKSSIVDINKVAVAMDKVSTMTLPNYANIGMAIDGLTAKQATLVLSTKNLSQTELEEIIIKNDLLKKYGAEALIKNGLLSANSTLLAVEKLVSAETLKQSILEATTNKQLAEEILNTKINTATKNEEGVAEILLTKAMMNDLVTRGLLTSEKAKEILSSFGVVTADNAERASKNSLTAATLAQAKAQATLIATNPITLIMGVATAIYGAVKAYDALTISVEECKEKVDNLMSSYNSVIDEANNNASRIEELISEYETLSKGVNNLGKNVSLTTDEYSKYNDIVNEISEMFPTLLSGYTNEGNAILSLKGNVELLRNAYKEAQQEAYNLLITSGNDVINNFQNVNNHNSFIKKDSTAKEYVDIINTFYNALLSSEEDYRQVYKDLIKNRNLIDEYDMSIMQFNKVKNVLSEIGFNSNFGEKDKSKIIQSAKAYIQTYQSEINSALKNTQIMANSYLMTNEDYNKLNAEAQNVASILVNSINESIANTFSTKEDVGAYVTNIVDLLKNNAEIKDALVNLLTLDTNNISPEEAKNITNKYIDYIANSIGEDSVELKIRLGFENIDELATKYNNAIQATKNKFEGYDATQFFEDNSITQEEIDKWLEITKSANTATEAEQRYLNIGKNIDISSFSFSENQSKAIDDFQSKVSSLSKALQSLQSGDLSSNDTTDLMQDFPTLQEESGDLETAIKQLIDNALEELYSLLGENVPENLKNSLENITAEAKISTVSLEDSMSALESHAKVLSSANEQVKAGFAIDTLNEIISAYPQMIEAVAKYNAGLLSTTELFSLLEQCYEQDKNNYISAAMKKLETDTDLFNKIMNNEELKVKELAQAYGVDYANWKDIASAKYSTEKQLIDDLMQLWSSYFSIMYDKNGIATVAINDTYQNYDDSFDTDVINGGQSDFDEKYQEIINSVSKYNDIIERLNQGIQLDSSLDLSWQGISSSLDRPKSSSSSKSEFSEQIDFAKYKLEELEKELDKIQSKIDNAAESSLKNHYINQLINLEEQKRTTLLETLKLYQSEAEKSFSLIPTEYQEIAQNGSIEIKDFVGENNEKVVEAIKNYRTWSDSVAETETELYHLDSTIQSLKLDKFHNIEGEYQNQLTIVSSFVDQFKDQIDLFENQGYVVSEKMYQQMIEKTNWQVKMLQKERDTLVHQMTETMKNTPNISKEHFYDMTSAISDIDKEINQCVSSLEDLAKAIRDLSWENFDRLIDHLSGLESELSNLSGLLDTYDLTIKGDFTDYGLAHLGILAQQYELARYETQQYSEAIKTLEQEYKNGEWSTIEYTEKLQELIQNQWDAINASTSAKDAILELAKTRIDSEITSIEDGIDAYEKLIQAQIKALQAEKDLHDFRKSVSEKQKDITSIEKQLAAIANDTSRAAEAKRAQLKEQLTKEQEELNELYYNQDNKEKQQALEDELERYKNLQQEKKDNLEESLKDEDKLISDFVDLVNENSDTIAKVLEQLAKEHGFKISNEIIKPWKGAGNAVTEYEKQLSNSSSNFVDSLNGVKDRVAELTTTANTLADSFTSMFNVNTSAFLTGLQDISELLNHINEAASGNSTGGDWMYDKDKENGSWWYQHKDGSYTKNDWEKIGGEWYHFDKNGWMQTGWYQDKDGEWYYLSDGTIGEKGQMLSNTTTPDGYFVDANGKWVQEVGQTSNFGSQSSSDSSTTNSETNTQKVNVSEIASTLRTGSSNTEDIKKLQTALKELGYDLGKSGIDGKFGSATKKALQAFQSKNELDSDGILGEKTKKAFANAGYSTGGVASILKENDDDGFITVQKGETILTKQFTNLMPDLVENISSFNQNYPFMFPSMPSFISNSTLPPINVENKIIVQGNLIGENAVPTVKEAQKMMDKSIDSAFRKVAERRQFQGRPFRK